MSRDFIDDLLEAMTRMVTPETRALREILVVAGMPEKTQNLRYLGYNRQFFTAPNRTFEFSAVALINNRRISHWRLRGYKKKLSRLIFGTRWTYNPLDLFLNNLRCDPAMMDILDGSPADYTLLGMLQMEEIQGTDVLTRNLRHIRPVIAAPGIPEDALATVAAFEKANEIRESKITGLPIYRKIGLQVSGR